MSISVCESPDHCISSLMIPYGILGTFQPKLWRPVTGCISGCYRLCITVAGKHGDLRGAAPRYSNNYRLIDLPLSFPKTIPEWSFHYNREVSTILVCLTG